MKYLHLRFGENIGDEKFLDPRGGMTFAWEKVDNSLRIGVAVCSFNDNFCRRIARTVAEGRMDWVWPFSETPTLANKTDKEICQSLIEQFADEDGFVDYEKYQSWRDAGRLELEDRTERIIFM